jgi:hypothetical protein
MKSKNQLTLIYIITAVFLAIVFQTVPKVFSYSGLPVLISQRPYLSFFTGITFRYIYPLTITETSHFENSRKQ